VINQHNISVNPFFVGASMESQTALQTKLAALLAADVRTNPDLVPFYLEAMELGLNRLCLNLDAIGSGATSRRAGTVHSVALAIEKLKTKLTGE
jgi:hypothetical protein